ncbi:O-antigen ligase family protein [Marinobacter shengliensis]|uniref:O-antigen ligase family protein n=1 Tax=Marinobacter shengliensis TaxID=1389223 RepID=UPI001108BF0D|nr:O-antigen ligase family protein [Marinobacter shengliensis]
MTEAHQRATTVQNYLLLLVIGTFPALSVIVDGYGSALWYFLGIAGILAFTFNVSVRKILCLEPKVLFFNSATFLFFLWSLIIYLKIDPSEFSKSRVERHALLLISIPVIALLFHARLRAKDLFLSFSLSGLVFLAYWIMSDGEGRLDGLVHAIHFGNVALITLIFCVGGMLTQTKRHWTLVAAIGSVGALIAFMESGSRGGLVALFLALLVVGLWFSIFRNKIRYFVITLALVASAGIVSVKFVDPISERYKLTLSELDQYSEGQMYTSMGMRLLMWDAALKVISNAPIIGSGFSGYQTEILTRIEEGKLKPLMSDFSSEPHNQYLYQLASHGLVGLFFLLLILTIPLFYLASPPSGAISNGNVLRVTLALVFLSFLFFGLTITLFDQRRVLQNFGLFYAVAAWFLCDKKRERFQ